MNQPFIGIYHVLTGMEEIHLNIACDVNSN